MKTVIKKQFVRVEEPGPEPARTLGPVQVCEGSAVPTPGIRVIELEGRVKAIEVTCSCGEVSLVELDYTETTPPAPPATENEP